MTPGPAHLPDGQAGNQPLDLSRGVTPELLDAFLDGLLAPDQALAVGRALEAESASRSTIALQQGIDRVLKEQFRGPGEIKLTLGAATELRTAASVRGEGDPLKFAAARPADGGPRRIRRLVTRLAAMLLLTVGVLWSAGIIDTGLLGMTPRGLVDPGVVYERKVATGFVPDWVCSDDAEFVGVTQKAFGQPLQIAKWPGVEVAGWSYYQAVLSSETLQLLVKSEGEPVLVLIDRKSRARRLTAPEGSGLHIHKRVLGKLVMYEMTRSELPAVLGLLYDPTLGGPPDPGCAEKK